MHYKYIFLIIDSDNLECYKNNREILQNAFQHYNQLCLTLFIRNSETIEGDILLQDNILYFKGSESQVPGIMQKTVKAFEYCLHNYSFDYLIRTNLSSFWDIENLERYNAKTPITEVTCIIGNFPTFSFPSGSGYIVPQKYIEPIVQQKNNISYTMDNDDVVMGIVFAQLGIPMKLGMRCDLYDDIRNNMLTSEDILRYRNEGHYHYRIKGHDRAIDTRLMHLLYRSIYLPHANILPFYTKDDMLTTDGYYDTFVNNPNVIYMKIDVFYTPHNFTWRNNGHYIQEKRKCLITSHSDYTVTDQVYQQNKHRSNVWFTVNKDCSHQNLYALPLGITNYNTDGPIFKLYGNLDQILEARQYSPYKKHLCYMNININTYPQQRVQIWNEFSKKDWVLCEQPQNTFEARANYLKKIAESKFTLCPRGMGIDTHRLWETLYLGSIPVVERSPVHDQWVDLPILFIDSWDQVTKEFLESSWTTMIQKTWNLEKLKLSYWKDFIQSTITESSV
jgi:hypothetical protein